MKIQVLLVAALLAVAVSSAASIEDKKVFDINYVRKQLMDLNFQLLSFFSSHDMKGFY